MSYLQKSIYYYYYYYYRYTRQNQIYNFFNCINIIEMLTNKAENSYTIKVAKLLN